MKTYQVGIKEKGNIKKRSLFILAQAKQGETKGKVQ
jgi:hypothetical protein